MLPFKWLRTHDLVFQWISNSQAILYTDWFVTVDNLSSMSMLPGSHPIKPFRHCLVLAKYRLDYELPKLDLPFNSPFNTWEPTTLTSFRFACTYPSSHLAYWSIFWCNMKVSMTCMLPTQTPKEETKSRSPPFYGYSFALAAVFCTVGWAHVVQITLTCGDVVDFQHQIAVSLETEFMLRDWKVFYEKQPYTPERGLEDVQWKAAIYTQEVWHGHEAYYHTTSGVPPHINVLPIMEYPIIKVF